MTRRLFRGEMPSWMVSMFVHMSILILLAVFAVRKPVEEYMDLTASAAPAEEHELDQPDQFLFSKQPSDAIGANLSPATAAGFAAAPTIGEVASVAGLSAPVLDGQPGGIVTDIPVQQDIAIATGPRFSENVVVRGAAGVGATGATGAVDRITNEILLSLEERRTLVVWFFDQSGSLESQRGEINSRFDRIYKELGVVEASGNPAFKRHESKPLLSAAVAFGQKVTLLTPKPIDDVQELKSSVASISTDTSGKEMTFSAVYQMAEKFKDYRTKDPRRNVMFVIFTDEVGDDEQGLDTTVTVCRKYEIPVYVVGVPAPFGRKEVEIKYVDPNPQFDQAPQWVPVRQGPETYLPEMVRLGFSGDRTADEPMDSGFGPYSLTRLCYETGGIYFTVHPNHNAEDQVTREQTKNYTAHLSFFFDPRVMRNYRPDYVSLKEYDRLVKSNKARQALVQAAQFSQVTPMESPQTYFPKVSEADFANKLSAAQQQAAVLEPKLNQIFETLKSGEKDRDKLTQPRWQAGFDLALGRVLAVKVRTETYNAMLAKAKQGMKFAEPKDDTWELIPADEISVGSTLEKQAQLAKMYLERVKKEHEGTPWGMLASRELNVPMGWKWEEKFTNVMAPKAGAGGDGGGDPDLMQDDKVKMLKKKGPPARPAPKL